MKTKAEKEKEKKEKEKQKKKEAVCLRVIFKPTPLTVPHRHYTELF